MQPYKPGATQQSVSAAAEALFETKNVAEIRQIEARTRRDIEEKNLQLRQLVGDSYRDLIEGTDKIIDISTKCHTILGNILSIQESFGSLAVSVTSCAAGGQEGKDFVRKHQELHAIGSRVKYIMDTPEIIWGCLDAQQHLEAARRLLRAHEVHGHLQSAYSSDIATKFPLVSHQWPLVLKFRQQILDIALSTLSNEPQLSIQAAADAAAAAALLEGLCSAAALQQFLAGRKQWATQQLQQALSSDDQEPGKVLAQLAQQVQSCIAQVGELFTVHRPSASKSAAASSSSLLQQVLQEDETDASELYFGIMDSAGEGSNSPEAVAWRQKSAAVCQQLTPLQRSQVQQACAAWLADVAAYCSGHGLQLLELCNTADSLLAAEQAVQQAIAEWTLAAAAPASASDEEAAAAAAGSDVQAADKDQAAAATAAAGSRLGKSGSSGAALAASPTKQQSNLRAVSDWDATCELVLREKLDLWQVLFHKPFLERCKQLIQSTLQDACSSISDPLAAALQQAAQHAPEAAGQLLPGGWPSFLGHADVADGVQLQMDRSHSMLGSRTTSGAWGVGQVIGVSYNGSGALVMGAVASGIQAADGMSEFRNGVYTIKQLFDRQLHSALQAVLLLTASAGDPSSSSGSSSSAPSSLAASGRAGSLPPSTPTARANSNPPQATAGVAAAAAAACTAAGKSRASELEQFTQQQCVELMQQLSTRLQQQLQELPTLQDGLASASTVEQVLLVARLCSALATSSSMLPALLGPPDGWLAACKAGPSAAPGSSSSIGTSNSSLPATLAHGVGALGPAAAALLRMHHPALLGQDSTASSAAAAAQLAAIQQQLHSIACSGYAKWASWVASSLSTAVLTALQSDELLHSSATPLSWVDTRVAAEGADAAAALLDAMDEGGGAGEMRFALPACPSAAVLQMLSLACWETRRAGEHLISTDALQLLQWELHGAALGVLRQLCGSSAAAAAAAAPSLLAGLPVHNGNAGNGDTGNVSEKGVLQLLFDQRLLRDVLGGGKPLGATAAATAAGAGTGTMAGQAPGAAAAVAVNSAATAVAPAAALAERKKLVAELEQQLQDQLDPIDWATYEPYLWANAQRYYQRTAVLLGTLAQLQKPYADAPRTAATARNDSNSLNLIPVAPRFHYLPISTPTALHSSAAAKQGLSSSQLSVLGSVGVGLPGSNASAAAALGGMGAAAAAAHTAVGPSFNSQASDLAAQYIISDLGSNASKHQGAAPGARQDGAGGPQGGALHMSADSAAAAGASALSAIQARLQGSSFGAFGSMLGDRAAEVTAMAQNFGDLLPSAALGGGLLSSFGRREGTPAVTGARK